MYTTQEQGRYQISTSFTVLVWNSLSFRAITLNTRAVNRAKNTRESTLRPVSKNRERFGFYVHFSVSLSSLPRRSGPLSFKSPRGVASRGGGSDQVRTRHDCVFLSLTGECEGSDAPSSLPGQPVSTTGEPFFLHFICPFSAFLSPFSSFLGSSLPPFAFYHKNTIFLCNWLVQLVSHFSNIFSFIS